MKVALVFGTRPEIIKVDPVMKELEKRGIETVYIHTGQHNLDSLMKDFGVKPDYVIDQPSRSAGKFKGSIIKGIINASLWTFYITRKIMSILKKEKPDVLLYQGDTLAIAAAAIAGKLSSRKPLTGHIEAGLRTGDLFNPFPEEISRIIADRYSKFLFAPTKETAENISSKDNVFVTGNTIVDAVKLHSPIADKNPLKLPKKYALVLVHRQENVHKKSNLKNLISLMSRIEDRIIFINHPTVMKKLEDFNLLEDFKSLKNVESLGFLDYIPFLKIVKNSSYMITDSGGLQEEACCLKKPCLVWRKNTERAEALDSCAVLVNDDVELCLKLIDEIENKKGFYNVVKNSVNPFGDGGSARQIVDLITEGLRN